MPMTSGQMRDAVDRYFEPGNGLDPAARAACFTTT